MTNQVSTPPLLAGQSALVTGTNTGIGAAVARPWQRPAPGS